MKAAERNSTPPTGRSFTGINLLTYVLLVLSSNDLVAAQLRWALGNQMGNWDNPSSWSTGNSVPGPEDEASIAGGKVVVNKANVGDLVLEAELVGGELEVSKTVFIRNSVLSQGHALTLSPLTVTSMDGLFPTSLQTSRIVNHGFFEVFDRGALEFENSSQFINQTISNQVDAKARFVFNIDPSFGITEFFLKETNGEDSVFKNQGGEIVNRSTGLVATFDVAVDNEGLMSAEKGPIVINAGGVHRNAIFEGKDDNELIFSGGTHEFLLDQGDVMFGDGVTWEDGEFVVRHREGALRTDHFLATGSTAVISGDGLIVSDSLKYWSNKQNGILEIGENVGLTSSSQISVSETDSIVNRGLVKFNGTLDLEAGSTFLNASEGFVSFAGTSSSQEPRLIRGKGTFENKGAVEFAGIDTKFSVPFLSEQGTVAITGIPGESFEVSFDDVSRLGQGAVFSVPAKMVLQGTDNLLQGSFFGSGTIHLSNITSLAKISGTATWRGPSIEVDTISNVVKFSNTTDTQSDTQWIFEGPPNASTENPTTVSWTGIAQFLGPGRWFNRSSTILKGDDLLFEDFVVSNAGTFHLEFSKLTLSKDSFLQNEPSGELVSEDQLTIRLWQKSEFQNRANSLLSSERNLTIVGDIELIPDLEYTDAPRFENRSTIVITNLRSSEDGGGINFENLDVALRGQSELRFLEFDSPMVSVHESKIHLEEGARLIGTGRKTPMLDILRSRVSVTGVFEAGAIRIDQGNEERTYQSEFELPITGGIRSREDIVSLPAEMGIFGHFTRGPKFIVIAPADFSVEASTGCRFPIIQAQSIAGIRPEQVRLDKLPGGPGHYEVEITDKAVSVIVKGESMREKSGESLDFEDFIEDKFGTEIDNPEQRSPSADPDGDGRNNALEYTSGSDPLLPDLGPIDLKIIDVDGSPKLLITHPRNPRAQDYGLKLKRTSSLNESFEILPESEFQREQVRDGFEPGIDRVEFLIPLNLSAPPEFFVISAEKTQR